MSNQFLASIDAAASTTDMTKAQKGGSDYVPPAAGSCRLRFVGYVETGKHDSTFNGETKTKPGVELTFEVSGPKHPPREVDGKKVPHLIVFKLDYSLNEKAKFFKLFQIMNYAGKAKIMPQLLGEAFKATLIHRTWEKEGRKGVAIELWDKSTAAWKIEPPRYELVNPEGHDNPGPTGEFALLKVDPATTPLRCFIWEHATMEMWQSIFIDGEYPAEPAADGKPARPAKSKNVVQNRIRAAKNYAGSPIDVLLGTGGKGLDLADLGNEEDPEADDNPGTRTYTTTSPSSNVDPLAGVGA